MELTNNQLGRLQLTIQALSEVNYSVKTIDDSKPEDWEKLKERILEMGWRILGWWEDQQELMKLSNNLKSVYNTGARGVIFTIVKSKVKND